MESFEQKYLVEDPTGIYQEWKNVQSTKCPFLKEGKTVQSKATHFRIDINTNVDCSTENVIYLLNCKKSSQQYIGETKRMLKERFSEHKT